MTQCTRTWMTAFLFLLLVIGPARAALDEGLVAHITFDECKAVNQVENGRKTQIHGSPQCVEGRIGKAFQFHSMNDFIQLPPNPALHLETFSLCAWVWPSETRGENIILARGRSQSYYLILEDGRPAVGLYSGRTPVTLFADSAVPQGEWSFICGTWDGGALKLYLDGKLASSKTARIRKLRRKSLSVWIGHRSRARRDKSFKGLLDDVRIYDRALSGQEIQELHAFRAPSDDEEQIESIFSRKKRQEYEKTCPQATFNPQTDLLYIPDLEIDGKHYKVFMLRRGGDADFTVIRKTPLEESAETGSEEREEGEKVRR